MNEDDQKAVIDLENFLKKTKGDKIEIKQPIKLKYNDIFNEEDKENTIDKIENKNINKNKGILRAPKQPNYIKVKKYNIVKESIVFQELDSKKSILNITNSKDEYNNLLFNSMNNNNQISFSQNIIQNKKSDYFRKKSSINFNELYEMKLKNVRTINILIY